MNVIPKRKVRGPEFQWASSLHPNGEMRAASEPGVGETQGPRMQGLSCQGKNAEGGSPPQICGFAPVPSTQHPVTPLHGLLRLPSLLQTLGHPPKPACSPTPSQASHSLPPAPTTSNHSKHRFREVASEHNVHMCLSHLAGAESNSPGSPALCTKPRARNPNEEALGPFPP